MMAHACAIPCQDMLSALCFSRGARAWQSVLVNFLLTEAPRDERMTCTPAGLRMIYSVAADDVGTRSPALFKAIADPT